MAEVQSIQSGFAAGIRLRLKTTSTFSLSRVFPSSIYVQMSFCAQMQTHVCSLCVYVCLHPEKTQRLGLFPKQESHRKDVGQGKTALSSC